MPPSGDPVIYRGYELVPQGDGTVAVYSQDGDLLEYADSDIEARKTIDEWMVAP